MSLQQQVVTLLVEAIKKRDTNIDTVARNANMSTTRLTNYITGIATPTLPELASLAWALDMQLTFTLKDKTNV